MQARPKAKVALEAEIRLAAARQAIDEGKTRMETEAYGEAFALFQKAARVAQEARMLVAASKLLEIDIGRGALEVEEQIKSENEIEGKLDINAEKGGEGKSEKHIRAERGRKPN